MFKFPEKRLDCKIFTKELNLWRLVNNYKIYDKGSRKKSFFFLFLVLKQPKTDLDKKFYTPVKKYDFATEQHDLTGSYYR